MLNIQSHTVLEQQTAFSETKTKPTNGKGGTGIGDSFRCDTCNIPLNSEFQVGEHMGSKKHKEAVALKNSGRGRGNYLIDF